MCYSFISKVKQVFHIFVPSGCLSKFLFLFSPYFSACENLPNSTCHFRNHKSVFLQLLHQSFNAIKYTPIYFFSSNIIYFGQRQPIIGQIFEIFVCSCQNSLNFSCQFWTDKSILLQILYHSPVPWEITTLYLFHSNIIYFVQKQPIKVQILRLSSARSRQNSSNSLWQFWNDKSIPVQIFHHSSVSLHITPLYFVSSNIIYFVKNNPLKSKSFRFSSAWIKISQMSHVNFERTCQFLFKFRIILHSHVT